MAKYEVKIDQNTKISISKGNTKLGEGIYIFNTLPGAAKLALKDGTVLTDVEGTCKGCGEVCEGNCYACRDAKRHHNSVIPATVKNTLMVRHNLAGVKNQLVDYLKKKSARVLRLHSSGEFESYEQLCMAARAAKELPNTKVYVYTKRYELVKRYIKEHGSFPINFTCNLSAWHNLEELDCEEFKNLNKFVYDDGYEDLSKVRHCPAVNKNGKSTGIHCEKCGLCYKNDGHVTAVYAH